MDAPEGRQAAFGRNDEGLCCLVLALWRPERPHNFGAMLRLAACLGLAIDVIDRVPSLGSAQTGLRQRLQDMRMRARRHTREFGEDPAEIADWSL